MTTLDLTKDPILLLLLKNMIRAGSRISIHDDKLAQSLVDLNQVYSNPQSVDYSFLNKTIKEFTELVKSYELSDHSNVDGEKQSTLPAAIYNFISKIEELKTKTDVDLKHFSNAELEERINNFNKLAGVK